jgi:hypothetical protein
VKNTNHGALPYGVESGLLSLFPFNNKISSPFLTVLSQFPSITVKDQVSCPHKTAEKLSLLIHYSLFVNDENKNRPGPNDSQHSLEFNSSLILSYIKF